MASRSVPAHRKQPDQAAVTIIGLGARISGMVSRHAATADRTDGSGWL
jgi:hypothetical protein